MATISKKRKATGGIEVGAKRMRVEAIDPTFENDEDEDDVDEYTQDDGDFSDDEAKAATTPNTPFSPGPARKKFPSELKTIKCTYEGCDKTFNRPARLATHLRSHTNERPFICSYEGCDKAYMDDKHLKAHIRGSHSNERSYACQWAGCDKKFLTSTRLNRHKAVHEGKNRFVCTSYPGCNQTFRKHQTLQRHIRSDHLELAPYPCLYVDPITNQQCNAGFDGAGGLRKHNERVHAVPQFFCPECFEPNMVNLDGSPMHLGFTTDTKLQAHIKKDHASCPFCDLNCSSKRELERHVETQHSGTTLEERKNVPCTYAACEKMFTKKWNRDQHIATAHEGQRYVCGSFDITATLDIAHWDGFDACAKQFYSKANLEDHIRTAHLGLQSLINSNRKKNSGPKRAKPSMLEELTGTAYERRNIACFMPECLHRFIRDYDLHIHLRKMHRLTTPVIEDMMAKKVPDHNSSLALLGEGDSFEEFNGFKDEIQEDIYNETDGFLGFTAPPSGTQTPYWIGADDDAVPDQWVEDEEEMRRLIDDDVFGVGEYQPMP
ncbi:hypothetical protein B0O99DRAFT_621800 [Bisporella sp. PMI_857]|nr:hypothetical protein B0O99DRAFT_621800 [Bisporella sp. PMI_857]